MKYTELDDCEEFYHKVEYYNKTKTEQLSYHYKEILKLLGEDPDREGLVKTPYRVAKAMQFMTRGYHENPEEILRSALFKEDYRQMVIVKNIEIYSMCEHLSSESCGSFPCVNTICCLSSGRLTWRISRTGTSPG